MIRTCEINEAEARSIILPAPTETYTVIPNGAIVDTILSAMTTLGYARVSSKFKSTASRQVTTGILNFKGLTTELGLSIGFINSYNKTRTLKIGCGSVVWICDNGMLSADFGLTRKHTGTADNELPLAVELLAEAALEEHQRNVLQRNEMLSRVLTARERASYFGLLYFDEGVLSPVQGAALATNLEDKDNKFQGDTLWDAYNNVTEVLKTTHPANYIDKHIRAHEVTRELFNLTV